MGKTLKFIVKTNVFDGFACANGKDIKKTSKIIPESIPKSMKNQYKNHARKRDIQKIKTHQQMIKKGEEQ